MKYYLQAILLFSLVISYHYSFAQKAMSCAGGAAQVVVNGKYQCPSGSSFDFFNSSNGKNSGSSSECSSCQNTNSPKCCACQNGVWSVDEFNGGESCYITGSNPCLQPGYRNQSAQNCRECSGVWNNSSGTCGSAQQQSQAQDQGAANACLTQYQSLLNSCETSKDEALNACDQDKDAGMNNVSNIASQIALVLGQATSSSTHLACSKMANLSQAANAAVLAFQGTCQSSISSCVSTCSEAANYLKQNRAACFPDVATADEQLKSRLEQSTIPNSTCRGLDSKVQQAQMAMNNIQQTAASSTACAQETAGVPDLCAANPTLAGCVNGVADCSSPSMATNKVCICAKNPSDPSCITAKKPTDPYGGSQDFSSRLAGTDTVSISGEDIPGLEPIAQGSKSGNRGSQVDGRVGGGAGIGGGDSGGGGMGGGSRGGGGGEEDPTRVTAGFYGSAGGMGGGGSNSGGAAGAGGRYRAQAGVNGRAGGPDLRSFLPGGKYDPRQRGLAGATGVDGITGPHSNIWKKIQNRYQATSPTLLP